MRKLNLATFLDIVTFWGDRWNNIVGAKTDFSNEILFLILLMIWNTKKILAVERFETTPLKRLAP